MTVLQDVTSYTVSVSQNAAGSREYIVKLPKVAYKRSHFGTCTCGVPSKIGIPCVHMVVIVKSSNIPNITRSSIMRWFWSTARWQSQLPWILVWIPLAALLFIRQVARRHTKQYEKNYLALIYPPSLLRFSLHCPFPDRRRIHVLPIINPSSTSILYSK